mgnify:FL=1
MDDLIEALTIARKYSDTRWPTNCSHDVLYLCVDASKFSKEDIKRMDELSFFLEEGGFASYRFGSC